MIYEILNDAGEVINKILADEAFVEKYYPGHYRLVGPEPAPPAPPPPMPMMPAALNTRRIAASNRASLEDSIDLSNAVRGLR